MKRISCAIITFFEYLRQINSSQYEICFSGGNEGYRLSHDKYYKETSKWKHVFNLWFNGHFVMSAELLAEQKNVFIDNLQERKDDAAASDNE